MLIAQITDLHVSCGGKLSAGRVDTRAAFGRCIEHLLNLSMQPDVLLISGDLAETGAAEEYEFVAEGLRQLPFPAFAVLGNHDLREAMRAALPAAVESIASGHLCIAVDRYPVALIGLDTAVPGQPHGELCADRLHWFEQTLSALAGKPAIIFMHHPPFQTGLPMIDSIALKAGLTEFKQILKNSRNVLAVLCGHAHRAIETAIAGIPVRLAPSSSHQFALDLRADAPLQFVLEPPQILLHRWSSEDGLVTHADFIGGFPGPFALG